MSDVAVGTERSNGQICICRGWISHNYHLLQSCPRDFRIGVEIGLEIPLCPEWMRNKILDALGTFHGQRIHRWRKAARWIKAADDAVRAWAVLGSNKLEDYQGAIVARLSI